MSDPTPNWLTRYRWAVAAAFALFAVYYLTMGDWVRGTIAVVCFAAFPAIVGSERYRRWIERGRQRSVPRNRASRRKRP